MPPTDYRFYKNGPKIAALYRTTFVTLRAIEHYSPDESQPDILCVKLCCSMTLRLKSPDKTNPNQNVKFWPKGIPKSLISPYFSGFITPVFLRHCGYERPENPATEPNSK
jgi:hypothetical protein